MDLVRRDKELSNSDLFVVTPGTTMADEIEAAGAGRVGHGDDGIYQA